MVNAPTVARWGGTSRFADVDGPVHYVDFGGPPRAGTVVLVHGLGGSHLNWCPLAPLLVPHARVLAVDLAGFGLTDPAGRSTTVTANAALLHGFLSGVAGGPVLLVGNSMGGMISILQAAAHPETVSGLVLIDPALPPALGALPDPLVTAAFASYALPGFGEWVVSRTRRRFTADEQVAQVYRLCCGDSGALSPELVAAAVALVEQRAGAAGLDTAFLAAARSVLWLAGRRWQYWRSMRAIQAPVLLLHGEADRLVSVRSARAAAARHRHWELTTFPKVGHVPQLEVPDLVAARILEWAAHHHWSGLTGVPDPGSQPQPTS
ncbi:alpha/beta hydrolase [Actinophytocola sp.]|uniref:alpha/beta fold hydrolase n=1 Tax=Actinophytocola sp. TaxID=1872138 RepID=UPI002D801908|nr:alpha/beta hydrolase [Actinophytocola sp.]HET9143875.1 alpha/beta hydrolase [Actinophytocola sp.]